METMGRNGYRKKTEEDRKKELRRTEEGKKMVRIDKYGKVYGKIEINNEEGKNKYFQKSRKKTGTVS